MRYAASGWAAVAVACGFLMAARSAESAPADQGQALRWLAPYLTDDFALVVLVDTQKLGSLWPAAQGLLKMAGGDTFPDLSDVELGAVVLGQRANTGALPRMALLLRTTAPFSAEQQQQLNIMLRRALGFPVEDKAFEQDLSQIDPDMARRIAPKLVVDGQTVILGVAAAVDALHAKTGSGAAMIKALEALGDHALRANLAVGEEEKRQANDDIDRQRQSSRVRRDLIEASILKLYEMSSSSRSVGVSLDFSPSLGCTVRFVGDAPEDLATIRAHGQLLLNSLKGFVRVTQAVAEEKGSELTVYDKVLADIARDGRLEERDGMLQFQWQSSPEVAKPFRVALPTAVGEMISARLRVDAARARASKLKQLGNGLLLFADRYNERFPCNIVDAQGKPLMSWRVALLPVLEYEDIFKQLRMNEPWNSAHNAALLKQVDPRLFASNARTPDGHADMLAVIGKGFGFSPHKSRKGRGVVSIRNITDGMAYTAFAVEVDPANSVPWAKPEDYTFDPQQPTAGLGSPTENFFQLVFGDLRTQRISKEESAETLRAMFGRSDGEAYEWKSLPD